MIWLKICRASSWTQVAMARNQFYLYLLCFVFTATIHTNMVYIFCSLYAQEHLHKYTKATRCKYSTYIAWFRPMTAWKVKLTSIQLWFRIRRFGWTYERRWSRFVRELPRKIISVKILFLCTASDHLCTKCNSPRFKFETIQSFVRFAISAVRSTVPSTWRFFRHFHCESLSSIWIWALNVVRSIIVVVASRWSQNVEVEWHRGWISVGFPHIYAPNLDLWWRRCTHFMASVCVAFSSEHRSLLRSPEHFPRWARICANV